ncbi:hypothetical protein [Rosettibacter firmus]|uniref:hypothetical protein n=1 Tax=Rosettibacter firmus TaxID=3111522 RepID=UPI00336C0BF6
MITQKKLITSNVINNYLNVTLPNVITDDQYEIIKKEILEKTASMNIKGVILDVSATNFIDLSMLHLFKNIIDAIKVLGKKGIVIGMNSSSVSALVHLIDEDLNIPIATCFDEAVLIINQDYEN